MIIFVVVVVRHCLIVIKMLISQYLAYEYARRGACLTIAARREKSLREVAERALDLGALDVLVVPADVSKVEDCRRVVDKTMSHYGRREIRFDSPTY